MPAPTEITSEQLLRQIGLPDRPVIVDVSTDPDFDADPYLIPGAIRRPHTDLPGLTASLAGRPSVVVCQKGLKLSQGVAAWLRSDGGAARYLSGGNRGWRATSGAPRVPASTLRGRTDGGTLWVAQHRPGIDVLSAAWLIRRLVDAKARLLFVEPDEVPEVAERFGAVPLISLEEGTFRGAGTGLFDAASEHFGLRTAALRRMGAAIRGANLDEGALVPEAAGLRAVCAGLARQYTQDIDLLDAGLHLCDALYRWARDCADTAGTGYG